MLETTDGTNVHQSDLCSVPRLIVKAPIWEFVIILDLLFPALTSDRPHVRSWPLHKPCYVLFNTNEKDYFATHDIVCEEDPHYHGVRAVVRAADCTRVSSEVCREL